MIIIKAGKYIESLLNHPAFDSPGEALVCGMVTGRDSRGRRVVSLEGIERTIKVRQDHKITEPRGLSFAWKTFEIVQLPIREFCTKDNPYTPERDDPDLIKWQHDNVIEVGDQEDGYPGGVAAIYPPGASEGCLVPGVL